MVRAGRIDCTTLVALALAAGALAPVSAAAGPTEGGIASDNVRYVDFLPFEVATATGATVIGDYMYLTGWKTFSIYDVSDPLTPERLSITPFGFKFENEDVATNGKIMLFSESVPEDVLHVWDIEDKSNPVEIATLEGAGDHTQTCILGCTFSYGSDGAIVDLRSPSYPSLEGNWHELVGVGAIHDVDEIRRGFIVTSPSGTDPIQLIDVRNPTGPRVVADAPPPEIDPSSGSFGAAVHSTRWAQGGRDRFLLASGGSNVQARCGPEARNFWSYDASRWERKGILRLLDTYTPGEGAPTTGRYPASTCSTHWFEPHPAFGNGGYVALAYYENGTRFLEIGPAGKIEEAGWFLPYGGVTSATYWLTDEIVYAVDYSRGLDILEFTGTL